MFNLSFRVGTCHVSCNPLESLKNYRGLGHLLRDSDFTGMEWNFSTGNFENSPG